MLESEINIKHPIPNVNVASKMGKWSVIFELHLAILRRINGVQFILTVSTTNQYTHGKKSVTVSNSVPKNNLSSDSLTLHDRDGVSWFSHGKMATTCPLVFLPLLLRITSEWVQISNFDHRAKERENPRLETKRKLLLLNKRKGTKACHLIASFSPLVLIPQEASSVARSDQIKSKQE